jgi:hypothetical protein
MVEAHSNLAGRSSERSVVFPDVLLYRCNSGDGVDCLVTLDRRTVLMSRPLAGLSCRIRVPVRQYQAVALLVGERNHVIRLMHRDIALSLDVEEFESYATAEEYRERLADFLGLPSVIAAGTPSPEESLSKAEPGQRRIRAVKARRPRFLTRRHAGHEITIRKIEGREIIARH